MDPNTLNLDPDPRLWPNLDPYPDPGLYNQFWGKKFKIILDKKNFLKNLKHIFFDNYKNKMSPKGIFTQLSLWMWIYLLNLTTFYLHFILYLHVWIQIQKDPEYESNTDPDTQYWF